MERLFSHNGRRRTLFKIYRDLDRMATLNEELRTAEPYINALISRMYQHHRYLRLDFERIRTVYEFRSPPAVRAYAFIGIILLGILWSPHFVYLAGGVTGELWVAIYGMVITNLLLCLLYEVYAQIEDPFDAEGDDDLNFGWTFEVHNYMFEDLGDNGDTNSAGFREHPDRIDPLRRASFIELPSNCEDSSF